MQNGHFAEFLLSDTFANFGIKFQFEKFWRKRFSSFINSLGKRFFTASFQEDGGFSDELNRAKKLQQQFLPKNLNLGDEISLAAFYQPAELVGGDYYNFFKINDDQIVIYLLDVSGHGIDGAMLNIYFKNLIDLQLMSLKENGRDLVPNEIVKQITKRYIQAAFSEDYLVCLFLGVLDLNSFKFTYASAGFQTPMLVCTQESDVTRSPIGGLPISTAIPFDLYDVPNKELDIHSGTSILLFTDGMIEEERNGQFFSVNRLEQIVKSGVTKTPEHLKEDIIKSFNNFIGNKKHCDDVTFVILKRTLNKGSDPLNGQNEQNVH